MKCVVNWIPLRIRVRSRNTQPHLKLPTWQKCNRIRCHFGQVGSLNLWHFGQVGSLRTSDQEVRGSTPGDQTHHNFGPVSGIMSLMCSWSMFLLLASVLSGASQLAQVWLFMCGDPGIVLSPSLCLNQVWRPRNQTSCPLPVPHPANLLFRVQAVQAILTPGLETMKVCSNHTWTSSDIQVEDLGSFQFVPRIANFSIHFLRTVIQRGATQM